jgi:hypothetical protein
MHTAALIALYWGPRASSQNESAALLLQSFEALSIVGMSTFYRKGTTARKAKAQPFIPSLVSVTALLSRGSNRRDIGNKPIPELGQSFGLWSGGPEGEAYEFSGLLGSTSSIAKNNLLVCLPRDGRHALVSAEGQIEALFQALLSIARPEEAIVCEPTALKWHGSRLATDIPCLLRYQNAA